jgi:uncharacterized membrane protein
MTIGPVQLLVVSFDKPNFSGEIMQELNRLRENDVIRLVDALAVQKNLTAPLKRCSGATCPSTRPRGSARPSVR